MNKNIATTIATLTAASPEARRAYIAAHRRAQSPDIVAIRVAVRDSLYAKAAPSPVINGKPVVRVSPAKPAPKPEALSAQCKAARIVGTAARTGFLLDSLVRYPGQVGKEGRVTPGAPLVAETPTAPSVDVSDLTLPEPADRAAGQGGNLFYSPKYGEARLTFREKARARRRWRIDVPAGEGRAVLLDTLKAGGCSPYVAADGSCIFAARMTRKAWAILRSKGFAEAVE